MPVDFLRRKQKTEEGLKKSREGWFGKLRGIFRGQKLSLTAVGEVEEALLAADVGLGTTEKLLAAVKDQSPGSPEEHLSLLKQAMGRLLKQSSVPAKLFPGQPRPGDAQVVLVVGVNGVGKTTTIAKLAHYLKGEGYKPLIAAGDTFRAAAIEQLQVWGQRVGVEVIAHTQGADTGAVIFDAYKAAQARRANVLIVDTAGRLHTKHNLMEELRKIRRILERLNPEAPQHTLLVLDATTGQNGLAQARAFMEIVQCTGIVLAKVDGTSKGGIVFAIAEELKLPVLFMGTGEGIDDLTPFDVEEFVDGLFTTSQAAPAT
ncbi:MAG: signal recognition particle-docking protein FtsY [Dehalococcoidia bacterium]|nr:signal recognition particle-docking protein FtsY [Dehalococcoidia bacterium]